MNRIQVLILLTTLLYVQPSKAQPIEMDEAARDSVYEWQQRLPHLRTGIVWMSDEVYNGQRVDSLAQWGLHPYLQWMFLKQVSFNYYGDFYSNFDPHYALSSFGIAKDFFISDKCDASAGYNYWLVHQAADRNATPYNQNVEVNFDYSLGNFSAGAYSMFLFGHGFTNFVEPSVNWTTTAWLGRSKNMRLATGVTLWANFGFNDAGARPFQGLAASAAKKKARNHANTSGNVTNTNLADSVSRKYAWLNTQLQVSEEWSAGRHHVIAGFNLARPSGNSNGFTGHWLPYATLEYGYDLFYSKRTRRQ